MNGYPFIGFIFTDIEHMCFRRAQNDNIPRLQLIASALNKIAAFSRKKIKNFHPFMGVHLKIFRLRMLIICMVGIYFIVSESENMRHITRFLSLFLPLYHPVHIFAIFFGKICNSIVFCLIVKYFQVLQ